MNMKDNIEDLETILFSSDEEGVGFNVNGVRFSLSLEQADSILFFYIDSRCAIHYKGVDFLIDNEDAKKLKAKIEELKK